MRACFEPVDDKNMIKVNKEFRCSKYTGNREIVIKNPTYALNPQMMEPYVIESTKDHSTGFLGFGGKKTAFSTIEMPKRLFTLGEQVNMRVTSDNTQCGKALEQLKVKLYCKQKITPGKKSFNWKYKVATVMGQGCPAK